MKYLRTTKPGPYDHVTFCPLCGVELNVIRGSLDRLIVGRDLQAIEERVATHLSTYHAFRYAIWSRLGRSTARPWRWLITGFGT